MTNAEFDRIGFRRDFPSRVSNEKSLEKIRRVEKPPIGFVFQHRVETRNNSSVPLFFGAIVPRVIDTKKSGVEGEKKREKKIHQTEIGFELHLTTNSEKRKKREKKGFLVTVILARATLAAASGI